ncbi:MAG: nucleotidyltransferase family protein [Gemmatimonadota bacterium]|nr:nucleotidyltransferase family protein [Gemmatimonadota bacterium]
MIAAIVLAAGASRRFGGQKLLYPVRGVALVRASVERVLAAGPDRTIVVVGHDADAIGGALAGLDVEIVRNPHPESGLSSSLRAGLAAVPSGALAVLITLGDQPIDRDEVIPALVARFGGDDDAIVAPRYQGVQGLPVLFARRMFAELEAVTGDQGARSVIRAHPSRVAYVDFDFPMPPDVDTPADLERL